MIHINVLPWAKKTKQTKQRTWGSLGLPRGGTSASRSRRIGRIRPSWTSRPESVIGSSSWFHTERAVQAVQAQGFASVLQWREPWNKVATSFRRFGKENIRNKRVIECQALRSGIATVRCTSSTLFLMVPDLKRSRPMSEQISNDRIRTSTRTNKCWKRCIGFVLRSKKEG